MITKENSIIMVKKALFYLILFSAFSVFAQKAMQYGLPSPSAVRQLPKQDKQRLLDEDAQNGKGRLRCALLLPLHVAFPGDIVPETVAGGTIWRMMVEAEDAEAVNLYLEDFQLPKGVELSFYTPDFAYQLPTITSDENPESKVYVTDHLPGSDMVVELFARKGVKVSNCFIIKDIGYMYRPLPKWMTRGNGFGGSGDCEVNVNCPEGDNWQNEKKGIARILLVAGGGAYYCSGSLINNARNDKTPYFLTASHCGLGATEEEFPKWKFYFNYEAPSCANPEVEPTGTYITTGCEKIAEGAYSQSFQKSDFLLLKLDDKVASNSDLVFNGWNVVATPATSGVGIHHPSGDIKKISTFTKAMQEHADTHWNVQWAQTQTNWSVTEQGSSGSPIFDQNKYIVGTLTAGDADCAIPLGSDLYGKMSFHWDKNGDTPAEQLKPWLDPDNTGITKLQGLGDVQENPRPISGIYFDPDTRSFELFVRMEKGDNQEIKIFDIMGRLVMKRQISQVNDDNDILKIDVSQLAAGLYVIMIINSNGRKTQKIIKP